MCLEVNFNHIFFRIQSCYRRNKIHVYKLFWRKKYPYDWFLMANNHCWWLSCVWNLPTYLFFQFSCFLMILFSSLQCISVRTTFICRFHKQTFSYWSIDCTVCSLSMCSIIQMCELVVTISEVYISGMKQKIWFSICKLYLLYSSVLALELQYVTHTGQAVMIFYRQHVRRSHCNAYWIGASLLSSILIIFFLSDC